MLKIKLLLIVSLAVATMSQAQSVKGKLLDLQDNTPLAGATLKLTSLSDTTTFFQSVTDKFGFFEFNQLPLDSFLLQVSSIGYESYKQYVGINDSIPNLELGVVFVPKETKQLGGVTVLSKTPPAQQKGDTTQYNASQFKVNPDASAEDMMKKLPGVTVEKGQVTAQGEQVRKVTIDGRDFFGDDATAALRNLPAEVIDKIQVFDRLSDQAQFTGFDDGNAVKAINIVTKADMRNGQFGRVYGGYGTDDRYSAGGNMTIFNGTRRISLVGQANNINQQNFSSQDLMGVTSSPGRNQGGGGGRPGGGGGQRPGGGGGGNWGGGGSGNFLIGQQDGISTTNAFGINYSDLLGKKITLTGSYFFNHNKNLNNEQLNREYLLGGDSNQYYREVSTSKSNNYNHRINMRLEYKIDSSNSLIITPRLRFQDNNSQTTLISDLRDKNGLISESFSNDRSLGTAYNIENEILYRHAFKKRGRSLSLEFETQFSKNNGEAFAESVSRSYDNGSTDVDSLRQFTDLFNDSKRFEVNLAYTEPIGQKGQLQINYRPSFTDNHANQETYQYDNSSGKYSIFDDSLSNKLDNTYMVQNGGVNYRIGDRDNQISVGVDGQYAVLRGKQIFPTNAEVDRSFTNILPNIRIQKKLSARSSMQLRYRTRTNVPSVTQLQDVINIRNLLFPTSGNPNLDQDFTQNIFGRYSFTNTQKRTSFFANLFVQKTDNYITSATYLIQQDSVISDNVTLKKGARLTKPVNLDGYYSVRSFLTFGMPLNFMKSNLNWNVGYSYNRVPGLVDDVENISNTQVYNAGAVISSNISEYVDFTVSYSANFNLVKNSIDPEQNDNYFNHIAGAQLNLLSKKGWLFQTDLTNQMYRGLSGDFDQDYWLLNMSAGKKFLKDQKGEIRFSVFDLLKQNQAITRTATSTYIEDSQNEVLQRYFMLTFTYKLRNFGGKK